jgi:hypothetical protein
MEQLIDTGSNEHERALFTRDGDWCVPTAYTTGPWRTDAMHGGPPSALMGLAIHTAVQPREHVARVSIDLEKPVPLEPMRTVVTRRQVSRRVAHLEVQLITNAGTVASGRALLLQGQGPVPLVEVETPALPPLPAAPSFAPVTSSAHDLPLIFHRDAVEARFTVGDWSTPGPSSAWMRLGTALIAGEETNALSQMLAVADFGSPLSQRVQPGSGEALINVDVNVTLAGTPVGPWFCLQTQGDVSDDGIGLAVTRLSDTNGFLGVITQSQIVYSFPRR